MPSDKVYVRTFGCQMNVYDTGKMYALLARDGWERAETPEEATLILINTCSIREKAENKLHSTLGEYRGLRKRGQQVRVGVTGCVAQQEGEAILRRYPDVDLVVGPDGVPHIRELVARAQAGERVLDTDFLALAGYPFVPDVDPQASKLHTGFVTVQKGCDHKCTYCIVPSVRGAEVSRSADEVVAEVEALVAQGLKDITLIGQNVNGWGKGLPGDPRFGELLLRVGAVSGLDRLHYTTSHPSEMGPDIYQAHRQLPNLVPHLHLPVQSGNNRILKRMHRLYTREHYLDVVAALREARPDLVLGSDFIVGFPGETAAEFQQTLDLLVEADIVMSYSFKYSERPGTPAPRLPDAVPPEVAGQRLTALQTLQRERSLAWHRSLEGRVFPVLVEGPARHDEGVIAGRTPHGAMVNFPGSLEQLNQLALVRVTKGFTHSARGEQVGSADLR
ncbi:MAG: tRNA (N6-isopentenyl adenosine(37)-C2)-methylthiotransferase MiaB [Deltaproteobacteria bacterium]|nr:tRNA (N6-isopentenyl adenosine(37)-C2)-methylthiotransferase MiaB [Deltaproteobacteria bacterium]